MIRGGYMQVNLEIKKYFADNGITQAFVSKKTGIEPAKLSLSLQGERRLTLDEYAVICGVLGVDANKFLHPRLQRSERKSGINAETVCGEAWNRKIDCSALRNQRPAAVSFRSDEGCRVFSCKHGLSAGAGKRKEGRPVRTDGR